ncbi:hypothetical protein D3C81_2015410 [compost metagenome]
MRMALASLMPRVISCSTRELVYQAPATETPTIARGMAMARVLFFMEGPFKGRPEQTSCRRRSKVNRHSRPAHPGPDLTNISRPDRQ